MNDFRWEEDKIQSLVREAEAIFDRNTIGPKRYISLYEKYTGLLSGAADQDKDRFLASKPPLKGMQKHFYIRVARFKKGQIFFKILFN